MNIFMFIADVFCSKKWVCSHLFGCGKTSFEPLARGNVPNANQCIIASLSGRSGWPSYDKLGHWACPSTQEILCDKKAEEWGSLFFVTKRQRNGDLFQEPVRWGESFWSYADLSMLLSQDLNWNLLASPPALSYFDLEHSWKKRLWMLSKF